MTIKEMETLSGLVRANIRFYESEGLLNPSRGTNGYRDYSEQDLEILKKIKLLRSLEISLEEIKALHTGEHELSEALDKQIQKLSVKQKEMAQAEDVCRVMRQDGVRYETLDAEKYLCNLERRREKFSWESYWENLPDMIPKVQCPWRRLFARGLDEAIYSTVWLLLLVFVFRVNMANRSPVAGALDIAAILGFTLLFEPLFLKFFGTTPGKGILGLHVTDNDGGRLRYKKAFERTRQVLEYGRGYKVPVYTIYRQWKSYKTCTDGATLEWEYDSELVLRDQKSWRTFAYLAAYIAAALILTLGVAIAPLPAHRGDINTAQFCENYRRLAAYYGLSEGSGRVLGSDGRFKEDATRNVVYIFGLPEEQDFEITETDGVVTEVGFSLSMQYKKDDKEKSWAPDCQEQMQMAALAFVGAGEEFRILSADKHKLIRQIEEHVFEDFSFSMAGVRVTCDVEYSGYEDVYTGSALFPGEDQENRFSLKFSMVRE